MKRLLRRLSRTVAAAEDGAGPAAAHRQGRGKKGKGVPEGHVPVCVGEEGRAVGPSSASPCATSCWSVLEMSAMADTLVTS